MRRRLVVREIVCPDLRLFFVRASVLGGVVLLPCTKVGFCNQWPKGVAKRKENSQIQVKLKRQLCPLYKRSSRCKSLL